MFFLFWPLVRALVNILLFGKGKFLFFVVEMVAVRAGGSRCDERFVVAEDRLVVEIEIIVADLLPCLAAFAETVVEGSVQMVVRFPDLDDVPGMAVFDALFRVIAAERDHAPDAERITKNFDRFGDASQTPDALSQRSDDVMGVRAFLICP